MSVEFEEDKFISKNFSSSPKKNFSLVDFLVNKKIVKDESRANMILLVISILIIIGSAFVAYNLFKTPTGDSIRYSDLPLQEKLKLPKEVRDLHELNDN